MVTSPLVRAVQTAEIVAAEVGYRGRILASELIVPEGPVDRVVAFLRANVDEKSVALVAHEPILSTLAAALTHRARHASLRKAEALRLRLPDGDGAAQPRWRINPGTGRRERL
jgi:phosphohistidine phosphatase